MIVGDRVKAPNGVYEEADDFGPGGYLCKPNEVLIVRHVKGESDYWDYHISHEDILDKSFGVMENEIVKVENMTLTKQDFYKRIETSINRSLTEDEIEDLDRYLDDERGLQRAEIYLPYDTTGHIPEYIDIADVQERINKKKIGWWIYDKTTKTWLINLNMATHEFIMGTLYNIYNTRSNTQRWREDAAEKYIEELYGFYSSRAMNMYIPIKDDAYIFTPEEEVFEQVKGPYKWRGIK